MKKKNIFFFWLWIVEYTSKKGENFNMFDFYREIKNLPNSFYNKLRLLKLIEKALQNTCTSELSIDNIEKVVRYEMETSISASRPGFKVRTISVGCG